MKFRRIVFGLGAASRDAALHAALALAPATEGGLLGIFVEETDLLQLAALPFAREIAFPASTGRDIDAASMARALRARAHDVERTLARTMAGRDIAWTFEVARGSSFAAVLARTAENDLAVLSLNAGAIVGSPERDAVLSGLRGVRRPVLLLGDGPRPQAPLVVVLATAGAGPAATARLALLARLYGSAVGVLALREAADDGLAEELRRLGVAATLRAIPRGSHALPEALARERPGLVVLCGNEAMAAAVVGHVSCPILLLPE
jgi:hypothetical protein